MPQRVAEPSASSPSVPALHVSALRVRTAQGVALVDGVSLSVARGGSLGLVGESGSGKSLTVMGLAGLLAPGLSASGQGAVDGHPLPLVPGSRALGRPLGVLFQDSHHVFHPALRLGDQLGAVACLHHEPWGPGEQDAALAQVGLPSNVARAYPHQLSGGMLQRLQLAQALVARPSVLLADEPTTALDVTTQATVLDLLAQRARDRGLALVLVSHDLGVVARTCQRVAVMYAGRVVEEGPTDALLNHPAHPYTAALLRSRPPLPPAPPVQRLATLPGAPPPPSQRPVGCAFAPRCPSVGARCLESVPALEPRAGDRACACFHPRLPAVAEAP